MSKKKDLLKIKESIEIICDTHAQPLDTIYAICDCFNDILENKRAFTFRKSVKDFFEQFDFISIRARDIDWVIDYRG